MNSVKKLGLELDFSEMDLTDTDFRGWNLKRANFRNANLSGVDFTGAILPPPSVLLLANWGEVPKDLCRDLMRYDAANHPTPKAFDRWAKGGPCPYGNDEGQMQAGFARAANFEQEAEYWKPGRPPSALNLVERLFKHFNVKHSKVSTIKGV